MRLQQNPFLKLRSLYSSRPDRGLNQLNICVKNPITTPQIGILHALTWFHNAINVMVNHRSSRTMHRPHRSRTEIVIRILEIVSGSGSDGFTKYKIMYNAFLSYAQLKEYLTVLTDNDMLRYDLDSHTFKTTEKGRRFLDFYNQISDVLKTHRQQHHNQLKERYELFRGRQRILNS